MAKVFSPAGWLGLVLLASPAVQAQETPRALVERAIQAHGGMERLSRVQADRIRLRGTLEVDGRRIPFLAETIVQLPDRYRNTTEMTLEGRKYVLVHIVN